MKTGILVPFDGSKNAIEALQLAITMAKALDERLIVLNVQPSFQTAHTKMFFSQYDIHEYQEQLFHLVIKPAEKILKETQVEYDIKLRIGDAKDQICREATGDKLGETACSDTGVRWIVMGSRGMNPVIGGVLGSISYGVVNAAPCPITIVPYAC
jgi:nucleotide-binding universal stress UspA family protein